VTDELIAILLRIYYLVVFRPHRIHSMDAACSVVCLSVCWCAAQKRLNRLRCRFGG